MARSLPPLLAALALCAALAGCAHAPPAGPEGRSALAQWVPSPNHGPRRAVIVVLHATEQGSVQRSLDTLRSGNAGGPVSAHYLIGADGRIYQLVDESRRAWHAGGGSWGTITDLNSASIGIELDNDGSAPFPDAQVESLVALLGDVCTRLGIRPSQVIGHGDMAPWRKRDPGAQFPWQRLAQAGFGRWPQAPLAEPPPGFDPWLALAAVGYPLRDRDAAVRAFRRHYRGLEDPPDVPAALDAQDLRILHALAQP